MRILKIKTKTGLEQEIAKADLVITGEGRMDGQTAMGKAPIGIAKIAKKYGKPVIAFAGAAARDAGACNEQGIDAFFPILREAVSLEAAMKREWEIKRLSRKEKLSMIENSKS